ncbi:MAG: NADH:ubiquinone reductase (Na(+)-transporting) subunit B [Alphaproteobacteria bacterium]|nr:NADH:ubiquinone reductase (Na(+)-transporting) subunit B [Alphaproteobacteria bacterium]
MTAAEMAASTRLAPHIRDGFSLERAMRCVVVALVPCLFMALYNTGLQANIALAVAGSNAVPDWRLAWLRAMGLGIQPSDFWAAVVHGGLYLVPVLVVTVVVGGLWERLFAHYRRRPLGEGFVVVALLFVLLLPPTIPLWKAALGISFAIVVGKEIFGGTGRNFLNPALVGIAFLYVTYPKDMVVETAWAIPDAFTSATYLQEAADKGVAEIAWLPTAWLKTFLGLVPGGFGTTSTLACLIGAGYLLYTRVASARVMGGVLLGMLLTSLLVNQLDGVGNAYVGLPWFWHLTMGSFAFGAVFLATDPVSAAATNKGRWIYGLLIGFAVVVIRVLNHSHPDGMMFAILLGNIFAPLIDYLVMRANIRRRMRRRG